MKTTMGRVIEKAHERRVEAVVKQIREAQGTSQPLEFKKSSVPHFVPNPYKKPAPQIDLRPLKEILHIDPEEGICVVEPGVTFTELVKATLKLGFVPYVVPELKQITVGGAVSGCSLESMSYQHGGFHDTALEYEVVTGTGDVVVCSREEKRDLFEMVHGSYGTLGILTRITFKLHPAKRFVHLTYKHFPNFEGYWSYMQERFAAKDYQFIDGMIHSPDQFTLCLGNMVDEAPYVNRYDWLNIYYKSSQVLNEDYLSTHDYFFRYDAECHWITRTMPPLEWKPVRFAVGKFFLGSTNLVKWSNRLKPFFRMQKRPDVVVDVFIPGRKFEEFFHWYKEAFDFWPLWIVPYKTPTIYPWISDEHAARMGEDLLIDCAVYGKPNSEPDKDYSELIEKKTFELNGIKTLISRNHYDEKTFWDIYSRPRWESAKKTLDPDFLFGDLYQRFNPSNYQ